MIEQKKRVEEELEQRGKIPAQAMLEELHKIDMPRAAKLFWWVLIKISTTTRWAVLMSLASLTCSVMSFAAEKWFDGFCFAAFTLMYLVLCKLVAEENKRV